MSEPHPGELAGGFSICIYIYICMHVRYVRDSVYLYDLFKRRPAPSLGARSTAKMAWIRGMGKRSRAYFLSELNCKTVDREERLRQRTEYERARHYAETAEQKQLHLIVKAQGSSQG